MKPGKAYGSVLCNRLFGGPEVYQKGRKEPADSIVERTSGGFEGLASLVLEDPILLSSITEIIFPTSKVWETLFVEKIRLKQRQRTNGHYLPS